MKMIRFISHSLSIIVALFPVAFLQLTAMNTVIVEGYTSPSSVEVTRRAIAGIWRLRGELLKFPTSTCQYPMKEFTTFPKKSPHEYFLKLNEDGSFTQYGSNDEEKRENERKMNNNDIHGSWDYRDGELILAADRPEKADRKQTHDTMLVGTVVAKSQESLSVHPVTTEQEGPKNSLSSIDTHLSVPMGNVQVGKFMYPKKHKMFFEQPMFRPRMMGSFELKQILGTLNAGVSSDEEEDLSLIEKFRKPDFADKKFLLSTSPIPEYQPKGELRWSIKYNKYVRDPPRKTKEQKQREEEAKKKMTNDIRVIGVHLFNNNTFVTTAGLGNSTILRGKWWIVGDQRDQLYLQVWRFGFGRSVSGSTFSEGPMLSHEDAKSYWGKISYICEDEETLVKNGKYEPDTRDDKNSKKKNEEKQEQNRLQVKGSVFFGGLEPQPVARFIMREEIEISDQGEEDDDDDDDDDDDEIKLTYQMPNDEDGQVDWSNAFQ